MKEEEEGVEEKEEDDELGSTISESVNLPSPSNQLGVLIGMHSGKRTWLNQITTTQILIMRGA